MELVLEDDPPRVLKVDARVAGLALQEHRQGGKALGGQDQVFHLPVALLGAPDRGARAGKAAAQLAAVGGQVGLGCQDLVKEELYYIIAAIIIYVLPAFFSLYKFGKLASYHTWITKISAVLMSAGVVVLLGFDNNLLFHAAIYFLVIEMVENIAITFILPQQKANINSIWHAWKYRAEEGEK